MARKTRRLTDKQIAQRQADRRRKLAVTALRQNGRSTPAVTR